MQEPLYMSPSEIYQRFNLPLQTLTILDRNQTILLLLVRFSKSGEKKKRRLFKGGHSWNALVRLACVGGKGISLNVKMRICRDYLD